MTNFYNVKKENRKKHNPSWLEIFDHQYKILIIISSGSGKTKPLFNLINQQSDVNKIY